MLSTAILTRGQTNQLAAICLWPSTMLPTHRVFVQVNLNPPGFAEAPSLERMEP